ncbi:ATP binding cassette sub family G [Echinococcus multilocularis]|uniref:ATP binding cassette sub family G n=1 Tax=Echinococcus multilocularis TaxID=6211 RepID=A0A068YIE3_ECHMU|nr:ATP binding cassette sub family G [Echinococcus multilocularis]
MDLIDSSDKVTLARRHGFLTPGSRYLRENHCLLVDGAALGKASLRQVSEEDEEEEEEKTGEEERVLKTAVCEKAEANGSRVHHLAAHSFSVINNLMEKRNVLHRPISLMLPHARKVINWATRPQPASSVPYINFSSYFEEELFDGDASGGAGTNDRLSRKPTHGSARSPDRKFALSSFVEDLLVNPKPSGRLALGVSIPEDNSSCSVISRDRDGLCTSSTRSMAFVNPSQLTVNRTYGPSPLESQILPSRNSPSALPRDLRRGPWGSQTGLSVTPATEPNPLHPLSLSAGVGSADKGDSRGGGGDTSIAGVSVVSTRSMIQGSVITFRDVEYVVPVKKTPCSKVVKKVVLDGVSGIMRPGLNAIMGPTGCGKSSLLDVLAGRKDPQFLTGEVLIDGRPQPKNFKCVSGYVVQDDILMGTLTVRETLYLAAMLRRKQGHTKAETNEKINEILDELGLTKIADNKIGTELIRGISGGERKRTSIGMEIIADPPVLFLDEPTTGLDAFTAGSVIQTLKSLSRRGRTIILSIHQPKYSIYKLFDSLTLMSNGQIVYHGLARKAPINYFSKLGYVCEDHNNPPDFFLDILHGEVKPLDSSEDGCDAEVPQGGDEYDAQSDDSYGRMRVVSERLVNMWTESPECRNARNEVLTVQNRSISGANCSKVSERIGYAVSFPLQMLILCWRTFISLMRDPQASIVQTLVYLFFAVSMGVVYVGLDNSLESGIQNRSGLFFFATLQVVFVNIGSIELFLKERAIFVHEHSSGYYRVSAYFLAKLMCDVFPTKALPVFFFMPITYWMVGLVPKVGNFFFFELILTLGTISASAAAMAVSASVTLFSIANVIISILFVFMMVFGGFLINLNSMSPWLSWLRYLSIFHYTFGGLLVNELAELEFCPSSNRTKQNFNDTRECQPGRLYLDDLGYASRTAWDMWSNVVGLASIAVVCFTLCYCRLSRINTFK